MGIVRLELPLGQQSADRLELGSHALLACDEDTVEGHSIPLILKLVCLVPLTVQVTLQALDSRLGHTHGLLHLRDDILLRLLDRWVFSLHVAISSHSAPTSLNVVGDDKVELLDGDLEGDFAPWPVLVHVALSRAYGFASRCGMNGTALEISTASQSRILIPSVLPHQNVLPDPVNLLLEMSLSVACLRLQARDSLLLSLELELEPLKLELVIAFVSLALRCFIAQILLLSLQQLVRALDCLDLSCEHRYFYLRVCQLLLQLLDLVRGLSLLVRNLRTLALHLSLNCLQAAQLSRHVCQFLFSFAQGSHTVGLALRLHSCKQNGKLLLPLAQQFVFLGNFPLKILAEDLFLVE